MKKTLLEMFKNCMTFAFKSVWIILLVIILFALGRNLLGRINVKSGRDYERRKEDISFVSRDYNLDKEILEALEKAHSAAESYASTELDKWIGEVMTRVDEKFLDEYFSFVSVKSREAGALFYTVANIFHLTSKTMEEKLTEELEAKLDAMVLRHEISEARIKNIMDETIIIYLETLDRAFETIQKAHRIPAPAWNKYISRLCGLTLSAEQAALKESVTPFSVKALVLSGGALTLLSAKPVIGLAKKVSAKIAAKSGAKAVEKAGQVVAVKTSAKAGSKTAARMIPCIGWGITIALCVWDIIDYKISVEEGKKMLRENIQEYLTEVKHELMGSSSESLMTSLTLWENDFKKNLSEK